MAATPTYTTLATPGGTNTMASVATNKYNANIVYLTCGTRIYRSANKGATWTNISGALPSLNILKVIADDYSTVERLFVCMGNYVYYKDNTTTTWTLTSGLPTIMSINDFMVYNDSTSASIIRVGTYGRGSWECSILNNLPPTGTFASDKQNVCPGDTVRYHKSLFGNYTSFTWQFPGGNPAVSTADSPVVVYNTNGIYNASLLVTGPTGTDTVTMPGYIHVSAGTIGSVTEGFEGTIFPPAGWQQQSASGVQWQKTATAGGFGLSGHSILFDNFSNDAGGRKDRIILPKTDLTLATSAYLKFDVAYAYYPGYRDTLLVELSTDCGKSYSTIYLKDTGYLATAPDNTNNFVPAASEWRTDSISLNSYIGGSVQLCFTNKGHYGQSLYIDNVNLHATYPPTIGVNSIGKAGRLAVFPNPANDRVFIKGDGLSGNSIVITCYNSVGQSVIIRKESLSNGYLNTSLDVASLPRGVYEVHILSDSGEGYVEKVVVQ
jgi:PKD repeat protein